MHYGKKLISGLCMRNTDRDSAVYPVRNGVENCTEIIFKGSIFWEQLMCAFVWSLLVCINLRKGNELSVYIERAPTHDGFIVIDCV